MLNAQGAPCLSRFVGPEPRCMNMTKRRLCAVAVAATAVILSATWWAFVQPQLRFRQIVTKYPLGTEAQTVLTDFEDRVVLHRSDNFPGPDSTQLEKERWSAYYVDLPKQNAVLWFNYQQKLVRVLKYSDTRKPQ